MIAIEATHLNFEREPLLKPFGFKGGYISTVWHTVVGLRSRSGSTGIGLGTQSVLWSDANVFAQHTPAGGNTLMLMLTEYALSYLKGRSFKHPMDLIDELLSEVLDYGITVTKNNNLRATFALNALVAVDFALWLLYANEHGIQDLDTLLPAEDAESRFRSSMSKGLAGLFKKPVYLGLRSVSACGGCLWRQFKERVDVTAVNSYGGSFPILRRHPQTC